MNATPLPSDMSAAYRLLAEGFESMRVYRSGEGVLDEMIELLLRESERPPKEVKGVGQDFIDGRDCVLRYIEAALFADGTRY